MNRKGAWLLAVLLAVLCGIPARAVELEPAYVRTVFDQTNGLPTDEGKRRPADEGRLPVGGQLRRPSALRRLRIPQFQHRGRHCDAGVFVYENGVFTAVPCMKKEQLSEHTRFCGGTRRHHLRCPHLRRVPGPQRTSGALQQPVHNRQNRLCAGNRPLWLPVVRHEHGKMRGHAGRTCAGHAGRGAVL